MCNKDNLQVAMRLGPLVDLAAALGRPAVQAAPLQVDLVVEMAAVAAVVAV